MQLGSFLIVVFLLLVWTALGVRLIRRGRRGAARGTAPHCRKCGYNLTGRSSPRCSECGADLNEAGAITVGRWSRIRGLMILGGVIALVGLLPLMYIGYAIVDQVRWYEYAPTSWVLTDARSTDAGRCIRAISVLSRRQSAGNLTTEETHEFVKSCLVWHIAPNMPPRLRTTIPGTLYWLSESGCLTEQQREQFLKYAVRVDLRVRSQVVAGGSIPIEVHVEPRTTGMFETTHVVRELKLDGEALDHAAIPWTLQLRAGTRVHASSLPATTLGRHSLTCVIETELQQFNESKKKLESVYHRDWTLTAEFKVVTPDPNGDVKIIRTPDLDATIPACFTMQYMHASSRYNDSTGRLHATLKASLQISGPLPADVAFDVLAEFDERSANLGRITAVKGAYRFPWRVNVEGDVPFDMPARVDIILKPSLEAALDTVDLFEIWGGEVRLPNIEVESHEFLERLRQTNEKLRNRDAIAP